MDLTLYIKLETATLAKEKGFNPRELKDSVYNQNNLYHLGVTFVTQSILQKWLRDVHKINVMVSHKPNIKKWVFIAYDLNHNSLEYVNYYNKYYKEHFGRQYDSYEDALEEGLCESLNLL